MKISWKHHTGGWDKNISKKKKKKEKSYEKSFHKNIKPPLHLLPC